MALTIGSYIVDPRDLDAFPSILARATLLVPAIALIASLAAVILATVAYWTGAKLSFIGFGIAAIVAGATVGLSTLGMWSLARTQNVIISPLAHFTRKAHIKEFPARVARNVVYGSAADGTQLVLDIWPATMPASGALRPAFIRMHGGGWINGSKSEMANWNIWLNELGYIVFDVEYRMPPPERWKSEVGDVKCALGWVLDNANKYGVDPSRIHLTGISAGGNLAMLAAYSMGSPDLPASCPAPTVPIKSVVNFYGPSDLASTYSSSPSPAYIQNALARYIGGPYSEFPYRYKLLSPITHVSASSPPTLMFLGLNDRIVTRDQADRLGKALASEGVAHEIYLLPGADHGFDLNWASMSSDFAREMVRRFLLKHD